MNAVVKFDDAQFDADDGALDGELIQARSGYPGLRDKLFGAECGEVTLDELVETILEIPVRFPHIKVHALAYSNNGFVIAGRAAVAMRHAGISEAQIELFLAQATSGDLNRLVRVVSAWVSIQ